LAIRGEVVHPTHAATAVEAWLARLTVEKQATYRAYQCTHSARTALDVEALMHAALVQVGRSWTQIAHPRAYGWQTLRHAVAKVGAGPRRTQQ
jgi:hypothetical protein